jgi:RES domain-containing protein
MEVFRLSRAKFASPLTGKGAALHGARWNSIGVELIYLAANRSLAMAEVSVHFTLATLPADYLMMTIYIPDDMAFDKINIKDLPIDWNSFPHPSSTQSIGDRFVTDNKFCVLNVPSSVTPGDYNLLVNPNHPEFYRIKIIDQVRFPFDERIFKK